MLVTLRDFGRPLGWIAMLGVLLIGAAISGLLEAFVPGLGVKFTGGVAGWFRAIPDPYYTLTGALALGYTASRGAEKIASSMQQPAAKPLAAEE